MCCSWSIREKAWRTPVAQNDEVCKHGSKNDAQTFWAQLWKRCKSCRKISKIITIFSLIYLLKNLAFCCGVFFFLGCAERSWVCCAGRSWFGRRGTRCSQTARAWPRAAQHRLLACFNKATFFQACFFLFWFIPPFFFKTRVAPPEATPSPFGTATLRLAPSALATLGLRSAAKCAPRLRNINNLAY